MPIHPIDKARLILAVLCLRRSLDGEIPSHECFIVDISRAISKLRVGSRTLIM